MKKVGYNVIDVFTRTPFAGNPAGVVSHAEGLAAEEMQKIAREINLSETAFIAKWKGPEADYEVRFFTPTTEVPLCGHATLAAHFSLALEGRARFKGGRATTTQKTKAGVLPVEIKKIGNSYEMTMTQAAPVFGKILDKEIGEIARILGIEESRITSTGNPIQLVSTGHPKIIIPIKSLSVLGALKPDLDSMKEYCKGKKASGFHIFTFETLQKGHLTHVRHFVPAIGISEDPVTGMSNGAMGAYLVKHRLIPLDKNPVSFISEQGNWVGRPGLVKVDVYHEAGMPTKVQVSGSAVLAMEGNILL